MANSFKASNCNNLIAIYMLFGSNLGLLFAYCSHSALDNTALSYPAWHNLCLCYARPFAADVNLIEQALAHSKSSSKLGFCSLTRCFVEPSAFRSSLSALRFPLSVFRSPFLHLTALRALVLVLTFDNIVFSRPAGRDFNPRCLRPIAADVIEPSV